MKKILATLLCFVMAIACTLPAVSALTPHGTGIKMRNWLTNDPDYTFSNAYKTSVWYENFTALELTQNERNNVLRVAVSQLGYHEGDSAADFNGMNQNGSNNYIEYARLLVPHYNENHYEWCACFVNWCLNQARIDRYSSEISCWNWVGELKAMKYWKDAPAYGGTYIPLPADMIFFNWNYAQTQNKASGHIGYVLYTTDTHVYTVEGNADDKVMVRSYVLDDPCIIGYGTPDYKENNEPTIDYSYKSGMPAGYYVVNSTEAGLLDSPTSTQQTSQVPLGHRVLLTEVTGQYAKVKYADKVGYLPTDILYYFSKSPSVTVTYDANGGTNAPDVQTITMGNTAKIANDTPTLDGDRFIGWATRPFDLAPVYVAGSDIRTETNITLYAIWEKHSKTLAASAMADGTLVNYPRPTTTYNHRAITAGYLPLDLLTPASHTKAEQIDHSTYGRVLALSSTGASQDPYITIPYASLMKSLSLPIANASDIKYVVIQVMNQSLSNNTMELFYTCDTTSDDKTAPVVSATLSAGSDWQYVVFDMSQAKRFDGDIRSLRLDYENSAQSQGEKILVANIYLLKNDAELSAITQQNIYPFDADNKVTYEGVTPPSTPTDDTTGEENTTDTASEEVSQEDGTSSDTLAPEPQKPGCHSVLATGLLPMMLAGAVCVMKKRQKEI